MILSIDFMISTSEFIEAGRIANTHGVRGDVRLEPWADSAEFLTEFEHIYINEKPVKLLSAKIHKGCVIAALEGVDDIDAAIRLKGTVFKIKKADARLEEGKFFVADLIGLKALDADTGAELGIIAEVLTFPSHNVYVVKGQREILVPAVSEFIIETDLEKEYVKIRLIEGL